MRSKNCSSVSTEPNISAVHPANQRPKDRKMKILAIESSCDETAAAVVENGRRVLSSVVATQVEEHKLYGGVVPEIASRRHSEAIVGVVREALRARRAHRKRSRCHRRHLRAGAHRCAARRRKFRERPLSFCKFTAHPGAPPAQPHRVKLHHEPGTRATVPVPCRLRAATRTSSK